MTINNAVCSFPFISGLWGLSGTYFDHNGQSYNLKGNCLVSHLKEEAHSNSHIEIENYPNLTETLNIENEITIFLSSLSESKSAIKGSGTTWGDFEGAASLKGNLLRLCYLERQGLEQCVEHIITLSSTIAISNGFVLSSGKVTSEWCLKLEM